MTRAHRPLIAPGAVIREYFEAEAAQLAADWLAVFGRDRQGVNAKAFMWHVFSAARYPSVSGAEALQHYGRQAGGVEYVVLSNDRRLAFTTDLLPAASSLSDYFVFPPNLAWTMAFTHEDGWLGPYFARHPEAEKLDAENRARADKRRQAEMARQKGWA